jgi:hypothetical protein
MNRLRASLPLALAAAALAAGCGGSGGDPDADPAAIVPAGAPVYLEATLESDDDFDAVAKKLSGADDPGGELKKLFERSANEGGGDFKWDEDIAPWIGDRVAVFFTSFENGGDDAQGAVVATTEDADKAQEALEKELSEKDEGDERDPQVAERSHKDVEYKVDTANDNAFAIVEDYAVFGSEAGVKGAIDAAEGESLADADAFKKARDQVDDDALGMGYVRISTLLGSLGPQGAAAREALGQTGDTVAFALDAEDDAIELDVAALGVKGAGGSGPGSMLAQMPGDAWLAGGTAAIGKQLEQALQQVGQLSALGGTDLDGLLGTIQRQTGIDLREDLLSWMGDGAVFVRGSGLADIGGAVVIQSTDAAKSRALIPKLRRLARGLSDMTVRDLSADGVDAGLTVRAGDMPLPIHIAAAGEKFVIAVTDGALEAALRPSGSLGDSDAFKQAADRLGDGLEPALFADLAPIRQLVESAGQIGSDPDAQQVKRVLDQLTTVVAGGKRDGDVQRFKLSVGVK